MLLLDAMTARHRELVEQPFLLVGQLSISQ